MNPTLDGIASPRGRSDYKRERARRYHDDVQHILEAVDDFVGFVTDPRGHISTETLGAFWYGDARAQITIRSLGRLLDRDLAADIWAVKETLDRSAPYPLADFNESIAPHLFSLIDAIGPVEGCDADGREAAEIYHYASEIRSLLLQHVLTVVSERYQVPRFSSLLEATQWIDAYASLLQEAGEVIAGTQQLLRDEALAVQSYLDEQRAELDRLEKSVRGNDILARRLNWQEPLHTAEQRAIDFLASRDEAVERMAFQRVAEGKPATALEVIATHTARRAPRVGMLLMTLVGATTGGAAGLRAMGLDDTTRLAPAVPAPLVGQADSQDTARHVALGRESRPAFGVLVRRGGDVAPAAAASDPTQPGALPQTAAEQRVSSFFAGVQEARGRQDITIDNGETLGAVLTELEAFGYPRVQVLELLGLDGTEALQAPLSLGVRMSQGGRLLLFPPQRVAEPEAVTPVLEPAYTIQKGDTLYAIGRAFGVSVEKLLETNPQLTNPNLISVGETILIPGATWSEARRQQPLVHWGDTLERVAAQLGVDAGELAELNEIRQPDQWIYDGGPLVVPVDAVAPERVEALPAGRGGSEGGASAPAVTAESGADSQVVELLAAAEAPAAPANEIFRVHTVRPGDDLIAIATRYDTTVKQVIEDNALDGDDLVAGQTLLVRVPRHEQRGTVRLNASAGGRVEEPQVRSGGGFGVAGAEQTAVPAIDREALLEKYQGERWATLEEMPDEVREYFLGTVEEVAGFFDVRAGDIAGILKAEQNNVGWTLEEEGVSSAGATGVAQVVARTWNGWSNPQHDRHSRSLADIERYGGLGFDWSAREQWRAWKQGTQPISTLETTNADPMVFENGVAAIARHLVHWGLTRDAFERDPEAFRVRLADAIAVYNSGKPLNVSRNFTQSAANGKTVGTYVAEAVATAEAWEEAGPAAPVARLAATAGGRVEVQAAGVGGGYREARTQPVVAVAAEPRSLALQGGGGDSAPLPPTVAARDVEPAEEGEPRAMRLKATNSAAQFTAYPLNPMPRVFKPFGAAVDYQVGGRHTGIDVAGPDGATLYAVGDGTVVHVGPLYCDRAGACRGDNAVVLDLGNHTYAIYSHNSEALVRPGQRVAAGQPIGRQGNEGYSFGSHLHFEVHVGAPWSGDWQAPFRGGQFVDPLDFLPDA